MINHSIFTFIISSILLLGSCKSNKEMTEAAKASSSSEQEKTAMYTLSQGGCFGDCPIYTFTLFPDGNALLDKKKHMPKPGKYEMKLDDVTTMSIIRDLDKAKFMKLEDEYISRIPDMAMTTMTYTKAGNTKTVKGKENYPQELRAIQDRIELVMDSPGWKQIEAYIEDESLQSKELIMNELLIQPVEGVALSRWMKRYEEQGMRLINRIDEEQSIWLFTWNTNVVAPRKFMSILKKDADLKSVEFNYKINEER